MKHKLHIGLALFLPVQIIGIRLLAKHPFFVEHFYSLKIFPIVSLIEHSLFGWIPFSVGDLLYFALGIFIIRWIYKRFKSRFKNPKHWILHLFSFISVIYFCFHLCWGFNYYRLPLHKSLGLKADYSQEELTTLTKVLIEKSNHYQRVLAQNDSTKVEFGFTQKEIYKLSKQGYDSVQYAFPELKYNVKSVKSSLFSLPLTYMGFSGYLNPWTNEAQVNSKLPNFRIPTVTSHEMGHQLGYAKENEANFMAALSTINHPNPYFRYAGYTFALQYCLNDVYRNDKKKGKRLLKKLNPGVRQNYREVQEFWEAHENPFEPIFKLFYGNYLKVNNQPAGMKSYSYVVALLVNYYQKEEIL